MSPVEEIPVQVQGTNLYEASEKIYPREAKGIFQTWRNGCVLFLLGLYYLLPWVQWDARQAVLLDLPARKFHIFHLTFWPQDFIFLALLLVLAGLALFFFTAIAGRVWCGYACPQTVWTEAFIWMERWVEGTRAQQMKLSASPWNANKIRKRVSKQALWIGFSLVTGLTFVGYFTPIQQLVVDFLNLEVAGWSLFWVLFYGFATYGNAGFMREQVCKYMCPYARFQSAMFDSDTLIVAYDSKRGEPRSRGKKRKDTAEENRGDCIDCGICVQVCPTGIDIRDGLQYECIACAACIDACDEVMDRVELPRGLIKYSSENHDLGKHKSLWRTLLRTRVIAYATLLAVCLGGFVLGLAARKSFQVDIIRDRNALFSYTSDQRIENTYHVKVMNKSQIDQQYRVGVQGLDQAQVSWLKPELGGASRLVSAGQMGDFSLIVTTPTTNAIQGMQKIMFVFTEISGDKQESIQEESRFFGPRN
ncbi:MAG: cytochrome c oxidase accessory protein CcoG [Pseudomonadota bacterium]